VPTTTAATYWSDSPAPTDGPKTRYETAYVDEYVTECACVEPTSNSEPAYIPTTVAVVPVPENTIAPKPVSPEASNPVKPFTGSASQQLPATAMSLGACVAAAVFGLLL
jgi:hypothetical protein